MRVMWTIVIVAACGGAGTVALCHRSTFKTMLVHDACTEGGQSAAKLAMTKFAKDHGVQSCLKCHLTLTPYYDLRPEGLTTFANAGGLLLTAPGLTSPSP
jgi:hypothetical protein